MPPENAHQTGGLPADSELEDGRLVMMMDVERIISETTSHDDEMMYRGVVQKQS